MSLIDDALGKTLEEEEEDQAEQVKPATTTAAPDLGGMLAGGDQDDELFVSPAPTQEADSSGLRDMLTAGEDDDELFGGPEPAAAAAGGLPDAPPSALIEWQREKDQEIAEKDRQDSEIADAAREEAAEKLQKFHDTLRESQAKRAVLNKESDHQKLAELEGDYANPWEKVVKLIDFARQDLHVRDVARMKSLLLQLKQKPLVKS